MSHVLLDVQVLPGGGRDMTAAVRDVRGRRLATESTGAAGDCGPGCEPPMSGTCHVLRREASWASGIP